MNAIARIALAVVIGGAAAGKIFGAVTAVDLVGPEMTMLARLVHENPLPVGLGELVVTGMLLTKRYATIGVCAVLLLVVCGSVELAVASTYGQSTSCACFGVVETRPAARVWVMGSLVLLAITVLGTTEVAPAERSENH